MNEIEKRELIEQRRKILEAGTQRVDKRTGSFSFLTWSFFIAPLITGKEFLLAAGKFAATGEDDATAARNGAAPHATDNGASVHDPSKVNGDGTATAAAASSSSHVPQIDATGLAAQSHDDLFKLPNTPEAVAAVSGGGENGGASVDADSAYHYASTPIDLDAASSAPADLPSGSISQAAGESVLDSVQSQVLGGSFSPTIFGSAMQPVLATVTDTVNSLSHDVAGVVAPVEAAVQPVLATVTDTVSSVSHDVAGVVAPVEAAAQPVTATVTDTVSSVSHDVAGVVAPVEAAAQPVLATVTDGASVDTTGSIPSSLDTSGAAGNGGNQASDPLQVADQIGGQAANVSASAAPVVDAIEPALTAAAPGNSGLSHPATEIVANGASANPPPDAQTTEPVATTASGDASHPADTLLALATAPDSPSQSATIAPANTAATAGPANLTGDVIALNDAEPPPANTLFTGTQYTQYGIALSNDAGSSPQNTVSPTDATSAPHTSAPAASDIQQHVPPPPDITDPTHSTLTSTDHHAIL